MIRFPHRYLIGTMNCSAILVEADRLEILVSAEVVLVENYGCFATVEVCFYTASLSFISRGLCFVDA